MLKRGSLTPQCKIPKRLTSIKRDRFPVTPQHRKAESLGNLSFSDSSSRRSTSSYSHFIITKKPFQDAFNSINDLTLNTTTKLYETLDQILEFLFSEPLEKHTHESLYHLLNAAVKCQPDVRYLIIGIAVLLLKCGILPKQKYKRAFMKECNVLTNLQQAYESFGEKSNIARRNLLRFIQFFRNPNNCITNESDIDNDHYGIDIIIEYVKEHAYMHRGKFEMKNRWEIVIPKADESMVRVLDFGEDNDIFESDSPITDSSSRYELSYSSRTIEKQIILDHKTDSIIAPIPEHLLPFVQLFSSWDNAYEATKIIWQKMKDDSQFNIEELTNYLPISYAEFLHTAIRTYSNS